MRYEPLDPKLFTENRARLAKLLPPKSIAVLNANDVLPTNADGTWPLRQNSDLLHLTDPWPVTRDIEQYDCIVPTAHHKGPVRLA